MATPKQTGLDALTAQLKTAYNDQFAALNTLMADLQKNAKYLTALFGGSNGAGSLTTNKKRIMPVQGRLCAQRRARLRGLRYADGRINPFRHAPSASK